MKIISVKLPEPLDARIDKAASRRGVAKSVVIREALEAIDADSTASFADLASAACGVVSGPRDLSTNAKHLEGYGQ